MLTPCHMQMHRVRTLTDHCSSHGDVLPRELPSAMFDIILTLFDTLGIFFTVIRLTHVLTLMHASLVGFPVFAPSNHADHSGFAFSKRCCNFAGRVFFKLSKWRRCSGAFLSLLGLPHNNINNLK